MSSKQAPDGDAESRLMQVERDVSELTIGFRTLDSSFRDTSKKLDRLTELFTSQQSSRPAAWDKVLAVVNTGGSLFAMIIIGILWLASSNGAAHRERVDVQLINKASVEEVAVLKWRMQQLEELTRPQRLAQTGSNPTR